MTVICLLATMSIPLYTRAVEQARVDVASAKLRTIWSAQRIYWLENNTFTTSFAELAAMDLLDASIPASQSDPGAVFVYEVILADDETFLARALRNGSGSWTGQIQIDETGSASGVINGPAGQQVQPPPS